MLKKPVDWQIHILCDLAKQYGGQVAAAVKGNGGCASISVAETLVRASLPDFLEAESA